MGKVVVSIKLEKGLRDKLTQLARADNRSVSNYIETILGVVIEERWRKEEGKLNKT